LPLEESDVKSCVDRALDKIGPRLKYTVYLKMAEIGAKSGKRTARIVDNPDLLVSALKAIFGRGSRNIELKIMSEISQAAGLVHHSSSDFVSFLLQATRLNSKGEAIHLTVISELFPY
jgi:hypothetical protein